MNLPASAIEFLDAYRGLYRELYEKHGEEAGEAVKRVGLPIVHCYCFTKDIEGAEKDICEVSRGSRLPAQGFEHKAHSRIVGPCSARPEPSVLRYTLDYKTTT
jgi:tRNA (guanine37-N1)-methyltransferase